MTDKRQTGGKLASAKGFANESRLLGALLERGFNASRVDLPHSTYDVVVEKQNPLDIIRVQVKTVNPSQRVSFVGGVRGGVDREYLTGVKEYVQSTHTADIVVGVHSHRENGDALIDFYMIPTLLIETLDQKSISIGKLPQSKNNWEVLIRCKDREFVFHIFGQPRQGSQPH